MPVTRRAIMPMRSRFFRKHGDRASFKASEVAALFLVGLFLSGMSVLLCMAIDYVLRLLFGPHR
jgi:hypothetical protein